MGTLRVMLHVSTHDEKVKVTLQSKESEEVTAAQMTASSLGTDRLSKGEFGRWPHSTGSSASHGNALQNIVKKCC